MKEHIRRMSIAFVLTLTILGTGIIGLLAYDRMDREITGAAEASSRELILGSHVRDFDLAAADRQIDRAREMLGWIGGIPYAFTEALFQGAEWIAEELKKAFF